MWVLASKWDLVDKELSVQELCSLVDRMAGTSLRLGAPCEMRLERKKAGRDRGLHGHGRAGV